MLAPRHGDVVAGETASLGIVVSGVHSEGDSVIRVQLRADPWVADSWETVAEIRSAQLPTDSGYAWSAEIVPGLLRWPSGGILRVRAVDDAGYVLPGAFHDSDEARHDPSGIAIANPTPSPGIVPYLSAKGAIDELETYEYYQAIDAPTTLKDFRSRYGTRNPLVSARYYNAGDLAVGRQMRCNVFEESGVTGVACESGNYGEFGGDAQSSLSQAIEGSSPFATVCMVYRPPSSAPNAVQFMVYDRNGELVPAAQLDTRGDNVSIPNNCINCHGTAALYDPETNAVTGAQFLPFDPAAFEFSLRSPYTEAEQVDALRELNRLVLMTDPAASVTELVDGMYAPRTEPDVHFVPEGWRDSPESARVYREVVGATCRSCHASREGTLSFATLADFRGYSARMQEALCGPDHVMPNAEAVLTRFWAGRARAYAVGLFDVLGGCAPPP